MSTMTAMKPSLLLLLLLASLLLACGPSVACPAGAVRVGDRCVTQSDAGRDGGDTGVPDAAPGDAGPCGMTCPTATPVCDATSGTCVQCVGDVNCATPTAFCAANRCVACLADTNCMDPTAARCESGTCMGCDDSAQCGGIAGTEVCDTATLTCVECTSADSSACGSRPCRPDLRCSMYEANQFACQPCDTDLNCATGHVCVEQTYDNPTPDVVVGNFCAWRRAAPAPGPDGTCGLSSQPYATLETVTTLDGETDVQVCVLTTTTCVAFNQHRTPACDTAFADEQCGAPGQNDGRCRLRAGDGMTLCTYPCLGTEDCPGGSTCPMAGDRVCAI